jgi:GLPGLI family protein
MKNVFPIILMSALISMAGITKAQTTKSFQGTITYSIAPIGTVDAALAAQLPKSSMMSVKDAKSKKETAQGPAVITEITDATSKIFTILLDIPTGKYCIKLTEDSIKKGLAKKLTITAKFIDSTKVIAGYTCKKAVLTFKDVDGTENNETIFYTEDIGGKDFNYNSEYYLIPGLMMEYEKNTGMDITLKYTASEVKKGKISDKIFMTPSDFKELSPEEAKKMLGGD